MKAIFYISIGLNAVLLSALVWIGASKIRPAQLGNAVVIESQNSNSNGLPVRFNWTDIESTNYFIFISNLRFVGCPELTIRDIVKADLEQLYGLDREEIKRRFASVQSSKTAGLNSEFEASRIEQERVFHELFGDKLAETKTASQEVLPSRRLKSRTESASALPLVFQEVDVSGMNLKPTQASVLEETIREVREVFLQRIGGVDQDPNDPEYARRWREAQPEADELLKSYIGINAFQDYQLQVVTNSASASVLR